jgi:hypothetical protein
MLEPKIACMNLLAWIFLIKYLQKTANEIWLKLHELHDGTSNVREQKTLPCLK